MACKEPRPQARIRGGNVAVMQEGNDEVMPEVLFGSTQRGKETGRQGGKEATMQGCRDARWQGGKEAKRQGGGG